MNKIILVVYTILLASAALAVNQGWVSKMGIGNLLYTANNPN